MSGSLIRFESNKKIVLSAILGVIRGKEAGKKVATVGAGADWGVKKIFKGRRGGGGRDAAR